MNYKETLDFLFSKLPMYQRIGSDAFKKDLTNIIALCEHLGNPQNGFKSIHIAGTNGKGSVAHILSSILQQTGLKVGLYVSPHYKDFRERIKLNGEYITEQQVVQFVENNKAIIQKVKPSFFEITVAMAFDYFANQNVDIAVIETGLGGRLDSTNIINPILSIITNIGYDHQQFLGDTLPEIAKEKAGIIKPNIPVLIGEYQKEVVEVFLEKSKAVNAKYHFATDFLQIEDYSSNGLNTSFTAQFGKRKLHFTSDIRGQYQKKNLQTAFAAAQLLQRNFPISLEQITQGFDNVIRNTNFIGRFMLLQQNPTVIADSAHNADGLKNLIDEIEHLPFDKLHFVYGTVNDKDLSTILPILPKNASYYFCKPDVPRGLDSEMLTEHATKEFSLIGKNYSSVINALKTANSNASKNDLILVSGSIFVVAEVV